MYSLTPAVTQLYAVLEIVLLKHTGWECGVRMEIISHKGGWCPYSNNLWCLEGYCNDCEHGRVMVMQLQGKAKQFFQWIALKAKYERGEMK
jgi:hypothetical protein